MNSSPDIIHLINFPILENYLNDIYYLLLFLILDIIYYFSENLPNYPFTSKNYL